MITEAGANRVLTVDLHAGQIQGFFDIPTDNLFALPVIVKDIIEYLGDKPPMVVSPDVGGVVRARALARRLGTDLAIVDKRRERAGESEVMNIIGDVEGRACVLIDDIVDSGGTSSNAADALLKNGATEVYAYATHGVLSGGAVARIKSSKLKSMVVTDSIAVDRRMCRPAPISAPSPSRLCWARRCGGSTMKPRSRACSTRELFFGLGFTPNCHGPDCGPPR